MKLCIKNLAWNPSMGKPAAILWGDSSSPAERPVWNKTEIPSQHPVLACWLWVSHVGGRSFRLSQTLECVKSGWSLDSNVLRHPQARTTQLAIPKSLVLRNHVKQYIIIGVLSQRSGKFFYKSTDSRYFSLCGPCGLCHNYSVIVMQN